RPRGNTRGSLGPRRPPAHAASGTSGVARGRAAERDPRVRRRARSRRHRAGIAPSRSHRALAAAIGQRGDSAARGMLRPRRARRGQTADVDLLLAFGPPEGEILASAAAQGADLIVAGAHRARWLGRAYLGSVGRHLLRQSPVPLLLVPPVAREEINDRQYQE